MKVLVVDDNKLARMMLTKLLVSNEYEVAEASNGIEALSVAKDSKPDLIISDIMMPEMDGFEFLRKLKKDDELEDIPFVFYTAHYVSKQDEELAMSLGASRYFVKPKEPIDLLYDIEVVLREYEKGHLKIEKPLIETEEDYLRLYSKRLSQKLEEKYRKLEDTKNFLETVLDNMGDGVIVTDSELKVTYCSKKMRNIVKCDYEYGTDFSDIIHHPCISDMSHATQEPFEVDVVSEEGATVNLEGIISPAINEKGELNAHIGVFRDVTQRNHDREIILKKNEEISILYDFDMLLSRCTKSDELVERALNKISEIIPIEGSCLYFVDRDNEKIVVKHCIDMPLKLMRLVDQQSSKNPAVEKMLKSKEAVIISPISERIPDISEIEEEYCEAHIVTLQLQSRGAVIGFIDLMVSPYREISTDEQSLLHSIGMQLGVSLENLLIYEHLEQTVEERTEEIMQKNEELETMN
ncbi:MAG: response regulator, partial [Methanosarcinales archaeon]|nr:response regulator [Methanosarcinales archaeon]